VDEPRPPGARDEAAPEAAADGTLGQVRALIAARQPAAALAVAVALAAGEGAPERRELLLSVAVCERMLGRPDAALATLARLETIAPRYTRLHQERGRCHLERGDAARATGSFEEAVRISAALPASWQSLERLYRAAGRTADADNAAAHLRTLAKLPRAVVIGTALLADGETAAAEQLIRRYLLDAGDDIEAMRLLARIGLELDALDEAERLLHAVVGRAPGYAAARYDYAVVLLRRHRHREAGAEIARLLEADPGNRLYRTTAAAVALGLGRYEEAYARYDSLRQEAPDDAELQLCAAHALRTLGRTAEAIAGYRAAIAARPGYGEAYSSLANLKTHRFEAHEIEALRRLCASPSTAPVDRCHASFALGKALEDQRDYAGSFACYAQGNELRRREQPYDPTVIEAMAREQRAVCTAEFLASRSDGGCRDPAPIFIVGLPRSGSTLLEQILASHPLVEGTTELSAVPRLVQRLGDFGARDGRPRYPGVLARLSPAELRRCGEEYLEAASAYRSTGRPRFIDKNPNNFRHLGLIRLMLPEARIIDARRGAMACCFGNYKQLFATGQRFTYGLEDIGRYYRCYVELMQHWDAVLPGWVLRVRHEDVVADLEGSVRRLLAFCGLGFAPECLEFYRTARGVATPSAGQVRRPIYRDGVDQWQHYAAWLEPLRSALGPLADT
jgi:tetratricopeptide (TPR) repeat protein